MTDASRLPDGTRLFLGDGGLETTMIFERGLDLPCFASFTLLDRPEGVEALRDYYRGYLEIAKRNRVGFTFASPTWRASSVSMRSSSSPKASPSSGRTATMSPRRCPE